jgi:hypothetical protein
MALVAVEQRFRIFRAVVSIERRNGRLRMPIGEWRARRGSISMERLAGSRWPPSVVDRPPFRCVRSRARGAFSVIAAGLMTGVGVDLHLIRGVFRCCRFVFCHHRQSSSTVDSRRPSIDGRVASLIRGGCLIVGSPPNSSGYTEVRLLVGTSI